MKTLRMVVVGLAFCAAAGADDKMKSGAMSVEAKDLKWGEAPPDLPKGAKIAVLHGDPTKPGMFAARLQLPDGYKIPPHWHTQEEQLTVISGSFVMHMGDSMTDAGETLTQGAYHFLPSRAHHGAVAKGETVVQINGMGPFDIHYINPADNPNQKSARK